jgi:glycolate oxidase FAD binding subunit
LSGTRRLGHGPLRDHVLEVRFVTADGRVVKGGGPTVKNVTGYDLPRLFVGSFGTLGVLAQVTLRCRPRPRVTRWLRASEPPHGFYRPISMLWNRDGVFVRGEGNRGDIDAQARDSDCEPADAPVLPEGAHRGRISVAPGAIARVVADLRGARWCAELGVGTIHVATDEGDALVHARAVAEAHGGWLLREAGGDGIDGFGRAVPNAELMRRIKHAFDPSGKLAPGRLPL